MRFYFKACLGVAALAATALVAISAPTARAQGFDVRDALLDRVVYDNWVARNAEATVRGRKNELVCRRPLFSRRGDGRLVAQFDCTNRVHRQRFIFDADVTLERGRSLGERWHVQGGAAPGTEAIGGPVTGSFNSNSLSFSAPSDNGLISWHRWTVTVRLCEMTARGELRGFDVEEATFIFNRPMEPDCI